MFCNDLIDRVEKFFVRRAVSDSEWLAPMSVDISPSESEMFVSDMQYRGFVLSISMLSECAEMTGGKSEYCVEPEEELAGSTPR